MTNVHHIALTASNIQISSKFYDAILAPLGYLKHSSDDTICTWLGQMPEILLYASKPTGRKSTHETYAPGIHHIAFQVEDQKTVIAVFEAVKKFGSKILDEPREYPNYSEGYFAVFFLDPDGIKLEVAHIPNQVI